MEKQQEILITTQMETFNTKMISDENGAQQMVYKYETRFLHNGTQLTDEADYNTRLGNGESVYRMFCWLHPHCG